jgi:YhcH/YjgK/YiaL family protein
MILDSLQNGSRYESIHPKFKLAFNFLCNTDLLALPNGKIELDGTNVVVIVTDLIGKTSEEAIMETHNKYLDIQVPLGASETMGWIAGSNLKQPTSEYNSEKDVTFFADKATNFLNVQPFEFAIFFPEDGHQPGIAAGTHKKIIVKILL